MSAENVEMARAAYAAYARQDWAGLTENMDPAFEWTSLNEGPATGGPDAAAQSTQSWVDSFEDHELVVEELLDAGDHVVATLMWRGRGKASGAQVELRTYQVSTWTEGKCVRLVEYASRGEALAEAGLEQ